jgi:hypothetical protein
LTINLPDVDEAPITIETLDAKPKYQFWADKEEATGTTGGTSRKQKRVKDISSLDFSGTKETLGKSFVHAVSE